MSKQKYNGIPASSPRLYYIEKTKGYVLNTLVYMSDDIKRRFPRMYLLKPQWSGAYTMLNAKTNTFCYKFQDEDYLIYLEKRKHLEK